MRLEDWRGSRSSLIRELYAAECERWNGTLDWDFAPSCRVVEEARTAGTLPGFVAFDGGVVSGWTFFVPFEGELQVGGLVASNDEALRLLLEAILGSPEAAVSRRVTCLLYPGRIRVAEALRARGFAVWRHPYHTRPLPLEEEPADESNDRQQGVTFRTLTPADLGAVIRLSALAYGNTAEGRAFAPDDRPDQWARYVVQLLEAPGCGRFLPGASYVAEASGVLKGAVITTAVGNRMAHIAQVVVDPAMRGRRVGRRLVMRACKAAAESFESMSLIVAETNLAARSLYRALGFTERADFLFGCLNRADRRWQRWQAAGQ